MSIRVGIEQFFDRGYIVPFFTNSQAVLPHAFRETSRCKLAQGELTIRLACWTNTVRLTGKREAEAEARGSLDAWVADDDEDRKQGSVTSSWERHRTMAKEKSMARKDSLVSLRQILIKRRDALRTALAGDLSLLKELRQQTSSDVVDAALDSAQDEISSQLAEVESRELASIENALERMRSGNYGLCESCESAIPLARLQALPYATLCIQCQREAEKSGGYQRNPSDWARLLDSVSGDSESPSTDIEIDVS
ncbi:MAG: hypothetical protein RIS70_3892 [Planctomycetota bacterium]